MNGASQIVEQVARAIWEKRRELAKAIHSVDLEEWGDGGIPRANHIEEEARAAIAAMHEAESEELHRRAKNCTYGNPDCAKCNPDLTAAQS